MWTFLFFVGVGLVLLGFFLVAMGEKKAFCFLQIPGLAIALLAVIEIVLSAQF